MKLTYRQVLEASKLLRKSEKIKLRDELDEELDDDLLPHEVDPEFYQELERRRSEAERDPSIMIPWETVYKQLCEKYL